MNNSGLDIIFWLLIGAPFLVWLYYFILNYQSFDLLYFLLSKDITNGIFNALIADMILMYMPLRRWAKARLAQVIFIKQILIHLSIIAVVLPFLINIVIVGFTSYEATKDKLLKDGEQLTNSLNVDFQQWGEKDTQQLLLFGTIQLGYLE